MFQAIWIEICLVFWWRIPLNHLAPGHYNRLPCPPAHPLFLPEGPGEVQSGLAVVERLQSTYCSLHAAHSELTVYISDWWWLTCWDTSLLCPPLPSTGSCHWKLVADSSPSSILQALATRPGGPTSCQIQETGKTLWIQKYQWSQLNNPPLVGRSSKHFYAF